MSKSINEIYVPTMEHNETPEDKSKRLGLPLIPKNEPHGICASCGSIVYGNECANSGCKGNKIKLFD